MTTIATFGRQQDADLARSRIEAAGISVFTPDEAVGGFLGYEGPLVAGVRLQVADVDATRATLGGDLVQGRTWCSIFGNARSRPLARAMTLTSVVKLSMTTSPSYFTFFSADDRLPVDVIVARRAAIAAAGMEMGRGVCPAFRIAAA
jgi:hypothetical protein